MAQLQLVAHRGYPSRFPENSIPGMRAALETGCSHVEFDVHFSRDAQPVVVHDSNLRRVTGRNLTVYRNDFSELSRLPAGEPSRFGDTYRHLRLPHLDEMLALLDEYPAVTAFVEVKRASIWAIGRERALRALLPLLQARLDRAVLLSFDRKLVQLGRDAGLRTGWAFEPWKPHREAQARKLAPEFLFTSMRGLPVGPDTLWRGPWRWAIYEVEDLAQAQWLTQLGADLIETDYIAEWMQQSGIVPAL